MNWSDLSDYDNNFREIEGWRNPLILDEAEDCNAQDYFSVQNVDDDGDNCESYFESVPPKRSRMIVQYSDSEKFLWVKIFLQKF